MDKIKEKLNFNNKGRKIKKVKEGMIINKVEFDKAIIFCVSLVSQYSQINAKKVVKGIETIKPAKRDERLAIKATTTTTIAVMNVFVKKNTTVLY